MWSTAMALVDGIIVLLVMSLLGLWISSQLRELCAKVGDGMKG